VPRGCTTMLSMPPQHSAYAAFGHIEADNCTHERRRVFHWRACDAVRNAAYDSKPANRRLVHQSSSTPRPVDVRMPVAGCCGDADTLGAPSRSERPSARMAAGSGYSLLSENSLEQRNHAGESKRLLTYSKTLIVRLGRFSIRASWKPPALRYLGQNTGMAW
jgi:hypothetical protein